MSKCSEGDKKRANGVEWFAPAETPHGSGICKMHPAFRARGRFVKDSWDGASLVLFKTKSAKKLSCG
jgi:hypothetical protein